MKKQMWFASLVPVAAGLVAAGALVAEASAPAASIKLANNAALANPANSVIVHVSYSCMPSQFTYGGVNVDQSQVVGGASGTRIEVFGFGNFQPTCDDKSHQADVVVTTGWWYGGSFTTGAASANAYVYSGATGAQSQAEINIK